jgi:hypothetical protein
MATAQLTASSISTRSLASFQGLRPLEAVKFGASVGHLRVGAGLSQRSFNGLVVKAATVVTPKVVDLSHPFLLDLCYFCLVTESVRYWVVDSKIVIIWYVGFCLL